jgi:hypothetical protein
MSEEESIFSSVSLRSFICQLQGRKKILTKFIQKQVGISWVHAFDLETTGIFLPGRYFVLVENVGYRWRQQCQEVGMW